MSNSRGTGTNKTVMTYGTDWEELDIFYPSCTCIALCIWKNSCSGMGILMHCLQILCYHTWKATAARFGRILSIWNLYSTPAAQCPTRTSELIWTPSLSFSAKPLINWPAIIWVSAQGQLWLLICSVWQKVSYFTYFRTELILPASSVSSEAVMQYANTKKPPFFSSSISDLHFKHQWNSKEHFNLCSQYLEINIVYALRCKFMQYMMTVHKCL